MEANDAVQAYGQHWFACGPDDWDGDGIAEVPPQHSVTATRGLGRSVNSGGRNRRKQRGQPKPFTRTDPCVYPDPKPVSVPGTKPKLPDEYNEKLLKHQDRWMQSPEKFFCSQTVIEDMGCYQIIQKNHAIIERIASRLIACKASEWRSKFDYHGINEFKVSLKEHFPDYASQSERSFLNWLRRGKVFALVQRNCCPGTLIALPSDITDTYCQSLPANPSDPISCNFLESLQSENMKDRAKKVEQLEETLMEYLSTKWGHQGSAATMTKATFSPEPSFPIQHRQDPTHAGPPQTFNIGLTGGEHAGLYQAMTASIAGAGQSISASEQLRLVQGTVDAVPADGGGVPTDFYGTNVPAVLEFNPYQQNQLATIDCKEPLASMLTPAQHQHQLPEPNVRASEQPHLVRVPVDVGPADGGGMPVHFTGSGAPANMSHGYVLNTSPSWSGDGHNFNTGGHVWNDAGPSYNSGPVGPSQHNPFGTICPDEVSTELYLNLAAGRRYLGF